MMLNRIAILMLMAVFTGSAYADSGRQEIPFQAKRISYSSDLSIDAVLQNLSKQLGKTVPPSKLADFGQTREQYEAGVKASLGPSGFLSIEKIEYTEVLKKYGISQGDSVDHR